jgi:hypothetical protein
MGEFNRVQSGGAFRVMWSHHFIFLFEILFISMWTIISGGKTVGDNLST